MNKSKWTPIKQAAAAKDEAQLLHAVAELLNEQAAQTMDIWKRKGIQSAMQRVKFAAMDIETMMREL